MSMKKCNRAFSEVIESALGYFVAQSWEWDDFPEFGSLVEVENNGLTHIGCVTNINTGSIDPMRTPFPYKKTEEELRSEQPHIFEFLKTTYNVISLGYCIGEKTVYRLPLKPCKIHSFASHCSNEFSFRFLQGGEFLNVLFAASGRVDNFDELLIALVSRLQEGERGKVDLIEKLYEKLSLLTGNDYRRLKVFFSRVESLGR
jgi:hypothetical protein